MFARPILTLSLSPGARVTDSAAVRRPEADFARGVESQQKRPTPGTRRATRRR